MSAEMTLGDFLKRLEGVYKSVDVRVAAVKSDNMWQNALTVVRFSCLEVVNVEQQQKQCENKWGKVRTSNFQIEMQAWEIEFFLPYIESFNEGRLVLRGEDLQFGRSIDLLSLKGKFDRYGYTRRENHSWPCFEAIAGEYCYKLDNKQLQSEVKSQTYFGLYLLISELLEVDFHKDLGLDLIVNAPFYAAIGHVDFAEQKCEIQVQFHKDVRGLAVSAIVRRGDREESPVIDKASSSIKLEESEDLGDDMRIWTKQVELLNATPANYLSVSLMQTEPTALDIEKPSFPTQVSRLLESKKPAKAPLVAAFSRFCSLNELEEYLAQPIEAKQPFKKGKKDTDATFELAVVWLLGLCGFNIIWLGQTKHETLKENKVTRFSTDILASHHESKNLLLLVGCTIGSPKDSDIDNLKSMRRVLQDKVFKDTQLHIKPFIFSAVPELGNKERDGVKVLDTDDIRGILSQLKHGEIKRALNQYFGYELGFT
jgi:hypothetical protein